MNAKMVPKLVLVLAAASCLFAGAAAAILNWNDGRQWRAAANVSGAALAALAFWRYALTWGNPDSP